MSWNEEKVARMRELLDKGASAGMIAKMIGDGITRNAVISKAHRSGIALNQNKGGVKPGTVRPDRAFLPARPRPAPRRKAGVFFADAPAPQAVRKSLADLDLARECKWPLGDPQSEDFVYCGAPALRRETCREGESAFRPYCAGHCRLSYLTPAAMRVPALREARP